MLPLPEPFQTDGEQILIDLPGARAVFTTRRGGISKPPYDTFNLGILTDDDPTAVHANRASLADRHNVAFAWRTQVHGNVVHTVDAPNPPNAPNAVPADGDGVATATYGVAPLVLAADCLPVVIAAPGAVAAVHAGWQGLATGVIANGISAVRALAPSGPLTAAIGPGAGVCCYEVSDELIDRFTSLGHGARHEGRRLDLKGIAADQLRASGVTTVHDSRLCTLCAEPGIFFSHRRDGGVTGRQAGIAWLT